MKTTFPLKITFMGFFFWHQQFILCSTVHHTTMYLLFSFWRWVYIKDVSRQRELTGANVDKNVLCTWMLSSPVLRYCNKRCGLNHRAVYSRGWMGRGWRRRGLYCKVWGWWKVPEVKTGLKRWSKVSRWTGLVQCSFFLPSTIQLSILCFLMSSFGPCGIYVWRSSICCLFLMRDVLLFSSFYSWVFF